MTTPEQGLRERKKVFTRHTIAEAAFDLALAKGLDRLTIEDIAQKAFVSPRTVSNYFSGKEEAVIEVDGQDTEEIHQALAEMPDDVPVLEALTRAIVAYAETRTPKQLRTLVKKVRLVEKYPTLRPFQTAQWDRLEARLREYVADRLGSTVDEMQSWLIAGGVVSAVKTATLLWVRDGAPNGELPGLMADACRRMGAGLAA